MKLRRWLPWMAGLTLTTPIAHVLRAEVYFTEDKAPNLFFPGIPLKSRWVELTDAQCKLIEKQSGEKVRERRIQLSVGPKGQAVFVDKVIGKHEFITYAVGIAANGTIKGIEILEYRETYGYEVRRPEWRRQFIGKTVSDSIKLDKDILNISGATLSSAHVTDGVRRILSTYDVLRHKR